MRRATPAVSKETAVKFYNEVQKLIDEGLSIAGAVKLAKSRFVGTEVDGISYTTAYRIGTARDAYSWLKDEVTVEIDQTTEDIVESIKGFMVEEILDDLIEKEIIDEIRRNEIYQSFIDNERNINWLLENCSKELASAYIIDFFNEL